MANLDVALRLRLINGLRGPSQEAKRDLESIRTSAQRLNATRGGDGLARDLGRVVTAGSRADASLRQLAANRGGLSVTGAVAARLGADLTGVATAGGRVDAALRRVAGSGAVLSATGAVAARLGADLTGVATAGGRVDAALRRAAGSGAGLSTTAAVAARLGADLTGVATAGGQVDAALRRAAGSGARLSATGTVAARLGADLTGVATAGGRVDAALRRVAGSGSSLSSTGAVAARLGTSLTGVVTAGSQADAALRRLGAERAGIAGIDAVTKALAQDLDRSGSAATRTAAGLGRIGSERARIAGTAAVAAELARNLERAASVVPRIRLPEKPVRPWGEPGGEPPRRSSERAPRAIVVPPPETRRKGAPEAAENPSTMVGLGGAALKAAGGIYVARTAIRATVGEAIGFEKAWAEVIKKVNDAPNPEAMQQLQRTVAKTAIDLGMPRQGLAELTAEAGAAGIKFEDLERYVKLAAKASVGWDMTPRDAAQKLAEIKSAGQMTIAEMDVLANKINALADNSAAKEADIVEMFQRAGAPARAAGLKDDTTLAALTALRSGGMQAEVASRFFGAFTSKLATAGGEGKGAEKVNDALKLLGLTGAKVADGMRRDVDGTIVDILTRLGKHAEPVKVATGLMGQEWWDELSRFSGSFAEFKKQREFVGNSANFKGSLDNNLNVQLATTANHLQRLKALTEDIGDRMGRWALPGINDAIQKTIGLFDSLEKRRALRDAEKSEEEKGDPMGRLVTKTFEVGAPLAKKGLDLVYGAEPTADPARQVVERAAQVVKDEREAAVKSLAEAAAFEARAKSTKDKKISEPLMQKATTARREAAEHTSAADAKGRTIGPAGARDLTDVEFGEAAAQKSIETMRQLKAVEAGLSAGNQRNIRLPGTGVVMSRSSAEAEVLDLRAKMRDLTAGPDKVTTVRPPKFDLSGPAGQADMRIGRQPGAATAFPLSPDIAAPKFDAQPIITAVKQAEDATKGLQTTLKQDLTGPATESMQTYQTALSTGVQAAVALVVAAAAQMKAALSFSATPTITPSISAPRTAPAGGASAAPATASPARATGGGSAAPRLQSAGLRQRGGVNINGPVHVHGVRDVASLETGIRRAADRGARDTRDNGLHDLGSVA